MLKWLRLLLARVLRAGPVPRHLAFVMDGNRRFADRLGAPSVAIGHERGMQKLLESLEWCLDLGIGCVSVYAFSIDNFRRSPEEVATLMALFETKFHELAEEHELVRKHGMQVRVIGNLRLLPPAVQRAAERMMQATKGNDRAVLNICVAYASSQELSHAVDSLARERSETGNPGPLCAADLERHLYTQGCPPVDLLVRTSGEQRLSDFLLWQSAAALLHFTPVLWPEFAFPDLLRAIVAFQRASPHLAALRASLAPAAREPLPPTQPVALAAATEAAAAAEASVGKADTGSPGSPRTPLAAEASSPEGSVQSPEEGSPRAQRAAAQAPQRRRHRRRAVAGLPPHGMSLFLPPPPAAEDRAAALKAAGISGILPS